LNDVGGIGGGFGVLFFLPQGTGGIYRRNM